MKLWIVKRRVPLGRGERQVRVERTLVMTPTAEEAIVLAKGDNRTVRFYFKRPVANRERRKVSDEP